MEEITMQWLEDTKEKILRIKQKVENLEKENQYLIYENIKMKDYIKNYGITHGNISKPPTP